MPIRERDSRSSKSETPRKVSEPSPPPKFHRAEADDDDASSAVVISDEDDDDGFFLLGDFYFCSECFEPNGIPKIGTGKTSGRGGQGIQGRYAKRTPPELRQKHTQSHKKQSIQSNAAGAEHLFGIAPKNEAWVWALVDGCLSYNAFTRASFVAAITSVLPQNVKFEPPPYRQLRTGVQEVACHLRGIIKSRFGGHAAVLALDGGTLHRRTLLNFTMQPLADGRCKPLFVCSRQVPDGRATTITATLKEVRKHLQDAFNLTCIAVVSDNASAMARGIVYADKDSDDDEDAKPDDDVLFENDDGVIEDIVVDESDQPFSVHIRCWAHVMQLLIGDIAKKMPDSVTALRRLTTLPRAVKGEISRRCVEGGKSRKAIIMPAVTRWNSATRAAERILELATEIEASGGALEARELLSLRIFLVMTAPFCWATTKLQADDTTLQLARSLCNKIREQIDQIRNRAQEFPAPVRQKVLELTTYALERIGLRESTYLTNEITESLSYLHSTTSCREKSEALQRTVEKYFRTVKTSVPDLANELEEFSFRNDTERLRSGDDAYWNELKNKYPTLCRFRKEMMRLLCTEASVERSFQKQGDIWSNRRNRLDEATIQDEMFIAMNYKHLRLKARARAEEQEQKSKSRRARAEEQEQQKKRSREKEQEQKSTRRARAEEHQKSKSRRARAAAEEQQKSKRARAAAEAERAQQKSNSSSRGAAEEQESKSSSRSRTSAAEEQEHQQKSKSRRAREQKSKSRRARAQKQEQQQKQNERSRRARAAAEEQSKSRRARAAAEEQQKSKRARAAAEEQQ